MSTSGRFWLVRAASARSDCWVRVGDTEGDPAGDEMMSSLLDGAAPDQPVSLVVWNRGRRRGDLLWSGGSFSAISDRAVQVLEAIGATGWRSVPAHVRFGNGEELPGYQVLVVTGTCGDFFAEADRRRTDRGVDPFHEWDGSDVFWIGARPQFTFCVTDRVREAFDAAGLDRIEYEDPADVV
ncbi:hypothetical protein [Nocardioides dongxiaopingii]|uniref:hypothetical protein n=1 Tax=Nocardioides dongxiaopingii TaxID=2576036 RepID=UPI0010C761B4|nr:hypothetical protein [Nocardioides dongxiaopingii]